MKRIIATAVLGSALVASIAAAAPASAADRVQYRWRQANQAVRVEVDRLGIGGNCNRSGAGWDWPGAQLSTCLDARATYVWRIQAPKGTRLVSRYVSVKNSGLFNCKDRRTTVREVKPDVYEVRFSHGVRGFSQCEVRYAEVGVR
jgi:hypothetical protein